MEKLQLCIGLTIPDTSKNISSLSKFYILVFEKRHDSTWEDEYF